MYPFQLKPLLVTLLFSAGCKLHVWPQSGHFSNQDLSRASSYLYFYLSHFLQSTVPALVFTQQPVLVLGRLSALSSQRAAASAPL